MLFYLESFLWNNYEEHKWNTKYVTDTGTPMGSVCVFLGGAVIVKEKNPVVCEWTLLHQLHFYRSCQNIHFSYGSVDGYLQHGLANMTSLLECRSST